jgi:hypothetical protein
VPVALQLGQEVAQRGRQQAQHRGTRPRDRPPRRPAARGRRGLPDAQRRQRRVAGLPAQPCDQRVRVRRPLRSGAAQKAPLRANTTGTVRARMTRSIQIDQDSM